MTTRNPARSGDKKTICWMDMDREDFYFDVYRSLEGQCEIYELALKNDKALVESIRKPRNEWERNLKKYSGGVCWFPLVLCACTYIYHDL
jgi:hypothetical protein